MGSAVGAVKTAAARIGVSVDEYERRIDSGESWCYGCRDWHSVEQFGCDATRPNGVARLCTEQRRSRQRERYTPRQRSKPPGPAPAAPRSGDRQQARQRINVEVRTGRRAHPNMLSCVDCEHEWRHGERRHEYDHYLGYDADHHYDVEPVCTLCHARRARERGEIVQHRGERGRYVTSRG